MSEEIVSVSPTNAEDEFCLNTIKWGDCEHLLSDLTSDQRTAVIAFDHELRDLEGLEVLSGSDPTRRPKYVRQSGKYLRDAKHFLVQHWPSISIESASNHPIIACELISFYLQSHFFQLV